MMKKETRATELDVEKCVRNSGVSRFDMVLVAAERTRELKRQNRSSGKFISAIDALLELQHSK
jgi:DNA-directed RNA polymerase subunit K/omega